MKLPECELKLFGSRGLLKPFDSWPPPNKWKPWERWGLDEPKLLLANSRGTRSLKERPLNPPRWKFSGAR